MTEIDISYGNSRVERHFVDFIKMGITIGSKETKMVKRRINELRAAVSFYEYLTLNLGKPHSLTGDSSDYYGVSITDNVRLIIKPLCGDRKPETLKICTDFEVKGVVKYHEGKKEWLIY